MTVMNGEFSGDGIMDETNETRGTNEVTENTMNETREARRNGFDENRCEGDRIAIRAMRVTENDCCAGRESELFDRLRDDPMIIDTMDFRRMLTVIADVLPVDKPEEHAQAGLLLFRLGWRRERGMTFYEIAEELNMKPSAVSEMVRKLAPDYLTIETRYVKELDSNVEICRATQAAIDLGKAARQVGLGIEVQEYDCILENFAKNLGPKCDRLCDAVLLMVTLFDYQRNAYELVPTAQVAKWAEMYRSGFDAAGVLPEIPSRYITVRRVRSETGNNEQVYCGLTRNGAKLVHYIFRNTPHATPERERA